MGLNPSQQKIRIKRPGGKKQHRGPFLWGAQKAQRGLSQTGKSSKDPPILGATKKWGNNTTLGSEGMSSLIKDSQKREKCVKDPTNINVERKGVIRTQKSQTPV